MKTPICDFVKTYQEKNSLRMHMPGHKGISGLGFEKFDITEIPGADVLYQTKGIIRESEKNAAGLFGTEKTLYSAEGSSLSIRAMLFMTALYAKSKNEKCVIACARNAHKTFITAAAILDIEVEWIFPEKADNILSCAFSAAYLESFLDGLSEKPTAVYVTSPDYLGNIADIEGISKVCRKHDCLLLADNAHGAYLNFLQKNLHPIYLGADLCCDSAHKTLPVLTGGGYLHISKKAPAFFSENAERAMAAFASTSPSYLILQSLDSANAYLADGYAEKLESAVGKWNEVKGKLVANGYAIVGDEPLKLTVSTKRYGYSGTQVSEILEKQNIFAEFADPDFVVLMLSPEFDDAAIKKVESVFLSIPKREAVTKTAPKINRPVRAVSLNRAFFSVSVMQDVSDCVGRVIASAAVSCPPAIPIVMCGEMIDETAVEAMKYYGIEKVSVIKTT